MMGAHCSSRFTERRVGKLSVMSVRRRAEQLAGFTEALRGLTVPGASILDVVLEPAFGSDGEDMFRALIVLDVSYGNGRSAELGIDLQQRVNRLAVEHDLDEYVYVHLYSEEEFAERRSRADTEDGDTGEIDLLIARELWEER